jgi:hypothetical protein
MPGDFVAVVFGADVPFILRLKDAQSMLLGESYMDGIMFGECLSNSHFRRGGGSHQSINLDSIDIY